MERSSVALALSVIAIVLSAAAITMLLVRPEGPPGPPGPQGPQGERGPSGPPGVTAPSDGLLAAEVYELSSNGVVSITVYDRSNEVAGTGSGFVYDDRGHIVTNSHVVETGVSYVVTFLDGAMERAELVGRDGLGDIAVLSVRLPTSARPLELGDSIDIKIGEPVYAVGSPVGLVGSITSGVVSQANRTGISILPMIQTDAPLNPGNSGGPLLNSGGEVIGINTAGFGSLGFEGLGFAIPSSIASRIIPSLIESGGYGHPFIGIQGVFLDPIQVQVHNLPAWVESGHLITAIIEGTAASNSDLRAGDVILTLAGYPIRQAHDIPYIMEYFYSPGEEVTLEVLRDEQRLGITLTLGARPAEG